MRAGSGHQGNPSPFHSSPIPYRKASSLDPPSRSLWVLRSCLKTAKLSSRGHRDSGTLAHLPTPHSQAHSQAVASPLPMRSASFYKHSSAACPTWEKSPHHFRPQLPYLYNGNSNRSLSVNSTSSIWAHIG